MLVGLLAAAWLAGCTGSVRRPVGRAVFFPKPLEKARLQYLTHFSTSRDVLPPEGPFSRLVFGGQPAAEGKVVKPYGVAVYRGSIYTCDSKAGAVEIFDLAEHRFGFLGVRGRGKLLKPINITIDEKGTKYVTDAKRREVVLFDATDTFAGVIRADDFLRPVDVAISDRFVYVCDSKACVVHVFDRQTRKHLRDIGGKGDEPGRFALPTNLAIGPDGSLYVSDTINSRVQRLSPEGEVLHVYGRRGDMPGEFARPKGIAVDRAGRLYVVDAAFENVQIFDPEGRLLLYFGEGGNGPGQLQLPAQVTIDYDHIRYFAKFAHPDFQLEYLVFVTSQFGPRKISVFGFGHYRRPVPAPDTRGGSR
jgi:DNA-binding beta-propeller fold protein YncE